MHNFSGMWLIAVNMTYPMTLLHDRNCLYLFPSAESPDLLGFKSSPSQNQEFPSLGVAFFKTCQPVH